MSGRLARFLAKAAQAFYPLAQYQLYGPISPWDFTAAKKINYAQEVGTGLNSSVLMSPIKWVQRNFPQAPAVVYQLTSKEPEIVPGHPMAELIRRPNPFYSGSALWAGTLFSTITDGSGYWVKLRANSRNRRWNENVTGEVKELWYVPHWLIRPMWPNSGDVFISHYEYRPGGEKIDIVPENVIHFRNGIDPRNPRRGLSMIESELRQIFTDDEAAQFVATLLNNMGVPGIVVSPDLTAAQMSQPISINADAVKAWFTENTTGDKRGEALVMKGPTKVQEFGFDPKKMDVTALQNAAEERVCAAIGIPPAVVGFATDQSRVGATMQESNRMAWENCLIPLQGGYADQLQISLLPEFEPRPELFEVGFDHSRVTALQENESEKADVTLKLMNGGMMTVAAAQGRMGLEVDKTQNVYLRTSTTVEVPEGTTRPLPSSELDPTPMDAAKFLAAQYLKAVTGKVARTRFLKAQGEQEAAATKTIEALFEKESTAVVKQFRANFKAATGETKDWLDDSLNVADWEAAMASIVKSGIEAGWSLLGEEIDSAVSFTLFQPYAAQYAAAESAQKIKGILKTTVDEVRIVITQGVEQGWSLDKIAKAVSGKYDAFKSDRALVIARTETATSMNYGKHQAAIETQKSSGLLLQHTWLAVRDDRTRDSHVAADGQTQPLAKAFTVGGHRLLHPGDPTAPAEEIINCRCTQVFEELQTSESFTGRAA